MRTTTERILADLRPLWRRRGGNFTHRWQWGRQSFVEGDMIRITTEQQIPVQLVPKTASGRDARIDGEVEWTSSDLQVIEVVSTGPMSAIVRSVNPGTAQVIAVFDADLGEGVRPVEKSADVEVVEAEAVSGEIVFGEPEPKP